MAEGGYETSVFLNCPFDSDYDPILQAVCFSLIDLGFQPRFARERGDSGEVRLAKIRELIESSRFSIHDLSRLQSTNASEYYRLNMPFELGLDYGCRQYMPGRSDKKFLVLEEKPYRYQAALSDLAGCDIEAHGGRYEQAVRKVRNWLVGAASLRHTPAASRVLNDYVDFQGWYVAKQAMLGFTEADILDYSTPELLDAMSEWQVVRLAP